MRFDQTQLDNGLTLIGEYNPFARTVAIGYFVRTGARDEPREINGVSHFLEHMMFKGTSRRTAEEVNREFDEMGADYNAFTSDESTVYYGRVLPEFQQRLLDLLTDMMRPALRREDFSVEKKVILEEIALYQDRPQYLVLEKAREVYYKDHPLGQSVLGTEETIKNLTRDQMYSYFSQRYVPNNMVLTLAGQYEWDQAVSQVAEMTKGWISGEAPRDISLPSGRSETAVFYDTKFNRAHLCFISPGMSTQDPRRYTADVISTAIGSAKGSRLYWALIEPGLADSAWLDHWEKDGTGLFLGYASCEPEKAQEVADRFRQVLKEVTQEGLQEDEIIRARRKITSGYVLQSETPMGRLMNVGFEWLYRRQYEPLQETVQKYQKVGLQEANTLLQEGFFNQITLIALGPVETLQ